MLTNTKKLTLPTAKPSIRVHTPLAMGATFITDVNRYAANYRQSRRMLGGYWAASFNLNAMPDSEKRHFFTQRIGGHITCLYKGNIVWEGLIWSMDLRNKGVTRRITLQDTRNAIKTTYNDLSGSNQTTTWYTKPNSISRFGRIEEILHLDKVATATAQAYAQTVVAESQIPLPNALSFAEPKEDEETTLEIDCVGYAYTLNFEYLNITDTPRDINDAISAALTASTNGFIDEGAIAANTVEVAPPDTDTKIWDWLLEITEIGDGSTPYTIQILNRRRLTYQPLSPNPTLTWDGKQIRTKARQSAITNHYSIQPGIIRDYTWPDTPLTSDYFLTNQRDSIVTEVEAGEEYTIPLLKTAHYEESDFMAALAANQIETD